MAQHYEIRLRGHLDRSWSEWLLGMTITHQEDGDTVLTGPIADQAALHALLNRMRDIGIPLVSVNPVGDHPGAGSK